MSEQRVENPEDEVTMEGEERSGARPGLDDVPPQIDTSKPSIARVYDAVLGGKDNYPVDRAVLEEGRKISPAVMHAGHVNRWFLNRGVRFMAEQGIDQFLDLGSGLPTVQNTHEVAQSINPEARVVYVDNDPIVQIHGGALLAHDGRTRVVMADVLDVTGVLGHPEVRGLLDFSRPIGLVMLAIVHHLEDEEDPQGVVDAYKTPMPPGSYFFLSHFCNTLPETRELEAKVRQAMGRGRMRGQDEITGYFGGWDLLEPGVVPVTRWRPDEPAPEPMERAGLMVLGGMARKPAWKPAR